MISVLSALVVISWQINVKQPVQQGLSRMITDWYWNTTEGNPVSKKRGKRVSVVIHHQSFWIIIFFSRPWCMNGLAVLLLGVISCWSLLQFIVLTPQCRKHIRKDGCCKVVWYQVTPQFFYFFVLGFFFVSDLETLKSQRDHTTLTQRVQNSFKKNFVFLGFFQEEYYSFPDVLSISCHL